MRPVLRLLLPGLLVLPACPRLERPPAPLRLVQFVQDGEEGVFLNETLVLHFSEDLDRISVNRETVRILGSDGAAAAGDFDLQRRQLRFRPALPAASDLTDGGFRPGATYSVELRGFPYPDGLRARNGALLAGTYRTRFRTAGLQEELPLFEDESLDRAEPLVLLSRTLEPEAPLRLECAEPLDPTSLHAEDFELRVFEDSGLKPVELRARLAVNERGRSVVELQPVTRAAPRVPLALRPGDTYYLLLDPTKSRLRDFGGHVVRPAWSHQTPLRVGDPAGSGPVRKLHVDFLPPFRATPEVGAEADGRAHWNGDVTVVLPRASGTGSDGPVELSGPLAADDVHASRLTLPAGAVSTLAAPGLVVLRSQGRMELSGRLERPAEPVSDELLPRRYVGTLLQAREAEGLPRRLSAHELLERAREDDVPWTVLVAGGDLVISGEVEVGGPLLLVAGGVIRATGPVRSQAASRVGSGGGPRFQPQLYSMGIDAVTIEPCRENRLVDTYRFSALSSPIRPPGGVRRWHTPRVRVVPGLGEARVRYVGVPRRWRPGANELTEPVDDPADLVDCDALRLLVELWVHPGEAWDPPRVDFVELRWE